MSLVATNTASHRFQFSSTTHHHHLVNSYRAISRYSDYSFITTIQMAPTKLRKKPALKAKPAVAEIPHASPAPAVITAPAVVQQQQAVQLKQSLQLVQSLLGVSFGTIAFLRDFFPETAFTKVRFNLNTFPGSYEAFSAAERPHSSDTARGFSVTRLQRGAVPAADRMLDWLEEGVFPMLAIGFLRALQLAVFNDAGELCEAYTFSFCYRPEGAIEMDVDDGSGVGGPVTSADAVQNVTRMMRRLLNITRSMPYLHGMMRIPACACNCADETPDTEKRLVLRVMCTDAAPNGYRPPGFPHDMDSEMGALVMHETDTFQLSKHDGGTASTGYHA